MTKNDNKIFLALLGTAVLLLVAAAAQNLTTALAPKKDPGPVNTISPARDIEKVRQDILNTGIRPHPAMYWEKL